MESEAREEVPAWEMRVPVVVTPMKVAFPAVRLLFRVR